MAELLRVEPSKFCAGEAWFIYDDGRQYLRKVAADPQPPRSTFPCPMIRRDSIDPVQSMADGRVYDSISALRRTYRADGNPSGTAFTEVGDAEIAYEPPKFDRKQRREDIKHALHDVRSGNVPPVIQAIQ